MRFPPPTRRLLAAASLAAAVVLAPLASSSGARESAAAASRAASGIGGVELTDIGDFDRPVYTATAPGEANRHLVFVVEKGGAVRVIRRGKTLPTPFLDIADRISTGSEQGLLSIAFAPDYARSRRFYVYFTDPEGTIRISQGRTTPTGPVRAKRSLRDVVAIPHGDFGNHNGGQVSFGPDGNLWLGTGDGGGACDPSENAQSTESLLGKLLRITPRKRGGYTIPGDNPYVDGPGADEIYASGLRNPFRFSFDRASGTIAIGDVGQGAFEEIDYETVEAARGANFGWDAFEGQGAFVPPSAGCGGDTSTPAPPATEAPIYEYGHAGGEFNGCSITGGMVVRDKRLPTLAGRYLYSDVCNGQLRSIVPALAGGTGDVALGLDVDAPTSFVADRRGRVHVTSLSGDVFRLDPAASVGRLAGGVVVAPRKPGEVMQIRARKRGKKN